ncbi:MAG TPA: M56 family metallopeptidase [Pirellulales bacterium]|jgi:beta-lactamase regulating signal transducer with metallopeptidase domain
MSVFNALDRSSETWLAWIVASSWQLALLTLFVALANRALRSAPARLRYGLWLLVLLKAFLPPGLTTPISIGNWGVRPVIETTGLSTTTLEMALAPSPADGIPQPAVAKQADGGQLVSEMVAPRALSAPLLLMIAWCGGVLLFWCAVGWRMARVARLIRSADALDEGPARITLEQISLELGLRRAPVLLVIRESISPFLSGVLRPRIVLPETLLTRLDDVELRAVLTHELVHCQRRDTWIGWAQVVANSLFWFHPFVWWANRQLRHERECVCDEAVLRLGRVTPQQYGECIFHVLTAARGKSLAAGSLVGVFERGAKLQNRLEEVMNFKPASRKVTWATRWALVAFAILFLPMAPGAVTRLVTAGEDTKIAEAGAPVAVAVAQAPDESSPAGKNSAPAADAAKKPFPQIVKSSPQPGATDVDPALAEITVTFDRDMGKGMSWTGGPPLFPPVDETKKARWIDARTCVLPVKLEKGAYYRVGINASSYHNFRGAGGATVPPTAIFFVTTGATSDVQSRVRAPKIVNFSPENGAKDADPATKSLQVTFDAPMGEGMSWTGSGSSYPNDSADGAKPTWSKDRLTCTLPVALVAGHDYELGLNSQSHNNFQTEWGVQLAPVVYKFRTRAAKD